MGTSRKGSGPVVTGGEDADRVRRMVDRLPLTQALATGAVTLPQVEAPSLAGIEVTVPRPDDITEGQLLQRFHEIARAHAETRPREPGQAIELGDDVLVDVLGYAGGKLIPFSARSGFWMELAPLPELPGFSEALVGKTVGEGVEVAVTLPADYPVEALRGAPARFIVDLRGAIAVTMPDTDSDDFLQRVGRGSTLDELMADLLEELETELADLLWVEAQDRVLDEVASRTRVEVPNSLVDEEIRRRWGMSEGKALAGKDFTAEEQTEALEGWLRDPETRSEAERRLRISLALKAVAERDRLVVTPELRDELLEELLPAWGLSPNEAKQAMAQDPALRSQIDAMLPHLLAVRHVMERAKVTFEGADEAG